MTATLKMAPFLIPSLVHKFINLLFPSFINHQSIFEAETLNEKMMKAVQKKVGPAARSRLKGYLVTLDLA